MSGKTFIEWKLPDEHQYDWACGIFEMDCRDYKELVDHGKYMPNTHERPVGEYVPAWRGVVWSPNNGSLSVYKATDYFCHAGKDEFTIIDPGVYACLLENSLRNKKWRDDIESEIKLNIIKTLNNFAICSQDDKYNLGTTDYMQELIKRANKTRRKIFYDQLGKYRSDEMEGNKKTFVFKVSETHEIYVALEADDYNDARGIVQDMLDDKVYDPVTDGVSYDVDFEKDYEGEIPLEKIGSDYTPARLYSDEKIKYRIGGVNKHEI